MMIAKAAKCEIVEDAKMAQLDARAFSDGTDVSRLYVAYPSANAILEFQPQLLTPNLPNARFVTIFR